MAQKQNQHVFPSVTGFTLEVGYLQGVNEAKLRIFDSRGWEFLGMGFNTGGTWHWQADGLGVVMILDDRKVYSTGHKFGKVRNSAWRWSPIATIFGPSKPWFPPNSSGMFTLSAMPRDSFMSWWAV